MYSPVYWAAGYATVSLILFVIVPCAIGWWDAMRPALRRLARVADKYRHHGRRHHHKLDARGSDR